jgi:hypothetical protein
MKSNSSKKKPAAQPAKPSNCGCGPGGCQPPREIARRDFLGRMLSSSVLFAVGNSLGYTATAAAGETAAVPEAVEAPPAPTTLPVAPVSAGALVQTVNHSSGIPLGGIGTGSVEILPDGCLDDWIIFNMGGWSPDQSRADGGPSDPAMDSRQPGAPVFPARQGGKRPGDGAASRRPPRPAGSLRGRLGQARVRHCL